MGKNGTSSIVPVGDRNPPQRHRPLLNAHFYKSGHKTGGFLMPEWFICILSHRLHRYASHTRVQDQ